MTTSVAGLLAGLLLAVAIATGGFAGFLFAVVLGAAGFVVGSHLDGTVDLSALSGRRRG